MTEEIRDQEVSSARSQPGYDECTLASASAEPSAALAERIARIIDPVAWEETHADDNEEAAEIFAEAWEEALAKARAILALSASPALPVGDGNSSANASLRPTPKSADTGAAPSAAGETGWLIELWDHKTGQFAATWWSLDLPEDEDGRGWTKDSSRALRFARERDAQAYIEETGWTEAKPTEHAWVLK